MFAMVYAAAQSIPTSDPRSTDTVDATITETIVMEDIAQKNRNLDLVC